MRVYIVPVEQYIPNESEALKYLRYMDMVQIENNLHIDLIHLLGRYICYQNILLLP